MQKNTPVQLEIFSLSEKQPVTTSFSKSIWLKIFLYEKIVLYTIVLLFVSIVAFSLGIKRGKALAILKEYQMPQLPKQLIQNEKEPVKEKITAQPKEIKPNIPVTIPVKENNGYTVQVASYKTQTYAQKEANKLNKKGLETLILPKGEYIILCVGKFTDKNEAHLILNKLKKTYQGCFVRRL